MYDAFGVDRVNLGWGPEVALMPEAEDGVSVDPGLVLCLGGSLLSSHWAGESGQVSYDGGVYLSDM